MYKFMLYDKFILVDKSNRLMFIQINAKFYVLIRYVTNIISTQKFTGFNLFIFFYK